MEQSADHLATAPVGKLLIRLSIPTIAAQLINLLYNVVDRIYIGHIPEEGSLALTGVGVCLPIILIISAFASLAGTGGAPRASIFMGKKDPVSAEKTLGNCFILLIFLSLVLTTVVLIWNRDLLLLFGASENTIEYSTGYMTIYAAGTVFVQLTIGLNAFITAQGFTMVSMRTIIIGAVCNIILDPIFIFLFDMGVQGAALATVISQAISCISVLHFLFGKKTLLRLKPQYFKLSSKIILPVLALGTSTFVMQVSESVIAICFNSSLYKYGDDIAVGAMTILSSVFQFAMLPMQGLAQGAQPICSYNFGAGNAARVKKTFRLLLISCTAYSFFLWGAVQLFPGLFARLFTNNAALAAFTTPVLRIYCAALLLFGIQIACQMTFISLGKAFSSVIVAVMRKFILLVPLIYIMPALSLFTDKTTAVYAAEPVADTLSVLFAGTLFTIQFKKAMQKMETSHSSTFDAVKNISAQDSEKEAR